MISLSSYTEYYNSLVNYNNYCDFNSTSASIEQRPNDGFYYQLVPSNTAPTTYTSSTGRTMTKNDSGAIPIPTVVSGGTLKILGYDSLSLQISNCFLVFDRLFEVSGIISSATTVQTLNTQSLPRYTAGTRVCAYIMATAATTGTFSAATSYTNQDGVSGRTGFFRIGGNNVGNAFQPRFMNLQTGDTGVRSVESIQIQSAITSSAPFNLVLAQPLGMFIDTAQILGPTKTAPNLINGNVVGGFPNVDENACLFYIRLFSTAGSSYNTGNNLGSFIIKEVYEI